MRRKPAALSSATILPRGWTPDSITHEKALALLALPREVGMHPSENEMILAGIGRYGPYLQMGKMYANLPGIDDVFEIQMNRAVAVIDEKKAGGAVVGDNLAARLDAGFDHA